LTDILGLEEIDGNPLHRCPQLAPIRNGFFEFHLGFTPYAFPTALDLPARTSRRALSKRRFYQAAILSKMLPFFFNRRKRE